MEDVLDVYHRPYSPEHPLVCIEESSKQHVMETRQPIEAKPGQVERYDYEYERNGVSNLFMLFAPFEGWRHVHSDGSPHESRLCPWYKRVVNRALP